MSRNPNSFQNLMNLEFSRLIVDKCSNIQFYDNTPRGV